MPRSVLIPWFTWKREFESMFILYMKALLKVGRQMGLKYLYQCKNTWGLQKLYRNCVLWEMCIMRKKNCGLPSEMFCTKVNLSLNSILPWTFWSPLLNFRCMKTYTGIIMLLCIMCPKFFTLKFPTSPFVCHCEKVDSKAEWVRKLLSMWDHETKIWEGTNCYSSL